jgi:hypothetical protein
MIQNNKLIKKKRAKTLNERRRKERGNEPFIIGISKDKFITCEEIILIRKEREEKAYEIYVKKYPF